MLLFFFTTMALLSCGGALPLTVTLVNSTVSASGGSLSVNNFPTTVRPTGVGAPTNHFPNYGLSAAITAMIYDGFVYGPGATTQCSSLTIFALPVNGNPWRTHLFQLTWVRERGHSF